MVCNTSPRTGVPRSTRCVIDLNVRRHVNALSDGTWQYARFTERMHSSGRIVHTRSVSTYPPSFSIHLTPDRSKGQMNLIVGYPLQGERGHSVSASSLEMILSRSRRFDETNLVRRCSFGRARRHESGSLTGLMWGQILKTHARHGMLNEACRRRFTSRCRKRVELCGRGFCGRSEELSGDARNVVTSLGHATGCGFDRRGQARDIVVQFPEAMDHCTPGLRVQRQSLEERLDRFRCSARFASHGLTGRPVQQNEIIPLGNRQESLVAAANAILSGNGPQFSGSFIERQG